MDKSTVVALAAAVIVHVAFVSLLMGLLSLIEPSLVHLPNAQPMLK